MLCAPSEGAIHVNMGLLKDQVFVCVDCESTGLDPTQDAIIEVGAVRFTLAEELARYETLVDPGRTIPADSQKIHGITDAMVAGHPNIGTLLPDLLEFLKTGIVIGHNIGFDLALIANAAKQHDMNCALESRTQLDTLRLARLYGDSPSNALEGLRKHFHIPQERAHRALDDALVNMEVFRHLVRRFKTTSQLTTALNKPIRMHRMPLGKHKGIPFPQVPENYLRWAVRQDFDQDLLFSIRTELKKRKRGGGFDQAGNPFAEL